jgi:hypothetical protein
MEHGIAVTADHKVYDDVTGECVGNEFQAAPFESEEHLNPYRLDAGVSDPIRHIIFRRLDGRDAHYRITHSRIRFVDNRAPSSTECYNMLGVAMRNRMVVTPLGKAYDAESGVFLGYSLRLTSAPTRFDDSYLGYPEDPSIRGNLIMPDGERRSFQTYASKVTHIDRETYTPPTQNERERRRGEFARLYGGFRVTAAGSMMRWNIDEIQIGRTGE